MAGDSHGGGAGQTALFIGLGILAGGIGIAFLVSALRGPVSNVEADLRDRLNRLATQQQRVLQGNTAGQPPYSSRGYGGVSSPRVTGRVCNPCWDPVNEVQNPVTCACRGTRSSFR